MLRLLTLKEYDFNDELYQLHQSAGFYRNWSFDSWKQHINWIYIDNPFRGTRSIGFVLKDDKDVIQAYIAACYLPFSYLSTPQVATSYGDFCINPSVSLKDKLYFVRDYFKHCETDLFVGLHASETTSALWKRFGAVDIKETNETFIKHLSRINHYISRFIGFAGLNYPRNIMQIVNGSYSLICRSMQSVTDFDSDIINLFCLNDAAYDISINRTRDYLDWRYLQSAFRSTYYECKLYEGNDLVFYAILQKSGSDGRICEIVAQPECRDVKRFLNMLESVVKKLKCSSILIKKSRIFSKKFLLENKFEVSSKAYNPFLYRDQNLSNQRDLLANFTFGDAKLY